jgi:nucleoside-diphosphate-sugar epimerase
MKILVLGGTGFIGSRVLRALSGHELWVFHRGQTALELPGVRELRGDRRELGRSREQLRALQPDVVLDMVPQSAADARAIAGCFAGVAARLVVVSSASVYRSFGVMLGLEEGPVDNAPSDEEAPLRRRLYPYRGATPRAPDDPRRWLDDYDKIPIEQAYRGLAELPCNVVRLPMVYGPGDPDRRFASYVRCMLDRRPTLLLHEQATAWRNSRSFVSNVADAIARVVERGAPGRVYNVAEPLDLTEGELIVAIGQALGWSGTLRTVPVSWSWRARPAIDEFPPQTCFAQHLRMDASRIRRELGFEDRVSFSEGLAQTLAEHVRSPVEVDYSHEDRLLQALESGVAPGDA